MAVPINLGLVLETRLSAVKMGRIVIGLYLACLLLFVVAEVEGTLTPSGTVSLEVGSQVDQTFTCSIPGTSVGWNITGLSGITAMVTSGQIAARDNARITTNDTSGLTQTSTITITGFTTADSGGTVQCIDLADGAVQGMATVSVRTLTTTGTFSLDCGSQQTFTCSVTGPAAGWTITGLSGISAVWTTGQLAAHSNARITTTDTMGITPSSIITITGFTTSDDGGTVQCINLDNSVVQGMATVSVGVPGCPGDLNVIEGDLCDSVNVTWTSSPSQTSATITSCQVSPQGSCMSVVCSSSPCTIQGVRRDREYEYTVLPTNNCGSPSGCTGNTFTFALAKCNVCTTPQSVTSIIPTVVAAVIIFISMLLFNIISVVVVFFLTRHCYKNTSKTSSPVKREDVYEQVQGGKTYEHITMTDSPAYGPVK